jgi:hypothetical protein
LLAQSINDAGVPAPLLSATPEDAGGEVRKKVSEVRILETFDNELEYLKYKISRPLPSLDRWMEAKAKASEQPRLTYFDKYFPKRKLRTHTIEMLGKSS